jgi:hypothetical protein
MGNIPCYHLYESNERPPWPESASELYRPSEKLVPTFADRVCDVVSVADPYVHILRFLDRSHYYKFLPRSSSVVLMRLSGPRSRPTAFQKMCLRREPLYSICFRPQVRGRYFEWRNTINSAPYVALRKKLQKLSHRSKQHLPHRAS